MTLTRYYILEGDTTTADGIVQKSDNTQSFKVEGKRQSCVGDEVYCPACNSTGVIIADGIRLKTSIGGRMPALNDDLCACNCNPKPKLIHSQTSFKETYQAHEVAHYQSLVQQRQQQQRQLAPTQSPDDLRQFHIHFRRADGYEGKYGFDWLRDEYVYFIGGAEPCYLGNQGNLLTEYRSFRQQTVAVLADITPADEPYVPAWLTILPKNTFAKQEDTINLPLMLELLHPDTPFITDGITLHLECSAGLACQFIANGQDTLPLTTLLGEMNKQVHQVAVQPTFDKTQTLFNAENSQPVAKTLHRYHANGTQVRISCPHAFDSLGMIKVIARHGADSQLVGVLLVYPNAVIPTAVIQPVFMVARTKGVFATQHPQGYAQEIQSRLLSQSLIRGHIKADIAINLLDKAYYIGDAKYEITPTDARSQVIDGFLKDHPPQDAMSSQANLYRSEALLADIVMLFRVLLPEQVQQTQTYLFFSDYDVESGDSDIKGIAQQEGAIDTMCYSDRVCNHWGNSCAIFNEGDLRTTLHELGHTFGLSHTFYDEQSLNFRQGTTDSLMDYAQQTNGTDNPHLKQQWSLFKRHWDVMHHDKDLQK